MLTPECAVTDQDSGRVVMLPVQLVQMAVGVPMRTTSRSVLWASGVVAAGADKTTVVDNLDRSRYDAGMLQVDTAAVKGPSRFPDETKEEGVSRSRVGVVRRAVVRSAWTVLVGAGVSLPLLPGCGGTPSRGNAGAGGNTTTGSGSGLASGTGGMATGAGGNTTTGSGPAGGTGGMATGAGGSASTSTIPWKGGDFYLYGI